MSTPAGDTLELCPVCAAVTQQAGDAAAVVAMCHTGRRPQALPGGPELSEFGRAGNGRREELRGLRSGGLAAVLFGYKRDHGHAAPHTRRDREPEPCDRRERPAV